MMFSYVGHHLVKKFLESFLSKGAVYETICNRVDVLLALLHFAIFPIAAAAVGLHTVVYEDSFEYDGSKLEDTCILLV